MYVFMGANGNITSRAVRALLQQGKPVRVIGRSAATLAPLRQLGAEPAVGDAQEANFLTHAFEGATGVYTMIPTDYGAPDMRLSQTQLGSAIAAAIALRLASKMSRHIAAGPPAIRVMSRNPGPAASSTPALAATP